MHLLYLSPSDYAEALCTFSIFFGPYFLSLGLRPVNYLFIFFFLFFNIEFVFFFKLYIIVLVLPNILIRPFYRV